MLAPAPLNIPTPTATPDWRGPVACLGLFMDPSRNLVWRYLSQKEFIGKAWTLKTCSNAQTLVQISDEGKKIRNELEGMTLTSDVVLHERQGKESKIPRKSEMQTADYQTPQIMNVAWDGVLSTINN